MARREGVRTDLGKGSMGQADNTGYKSYVDGGRGVGVVCIRSRLNYMHVFTLQ